MTTQTGTVKWFNESKGFGFIAQDAGGADLFAHFRDIQGNGFKTLVENQRVEFEVKQGQKGLQAANIRVPDLRVGQPGLQEKPRLCRGFFSSARLPSADLEPRRPPMTAIATLTNHQVRLAAPPGRPADARRLELHRRAGAPSPPPAACSSRRSRCRSTRPCAAG